MWNSLLYQLNIWSFYVNFFALFFENISNFLFRENFAFFWETDSSAISRKKAKMKQNGREINFFAKFTRNDFFFSLDTLRVIGRFVGGRLIHKQSNETKNYTPIWKPETVFSSVNNSKPTGFNVVIFTQVFGTPYKLNNFFCRKVFII